MVNLEEIGNIKVGEFFRLKEFTRSKKAIARRIFEPQQNPPETVIENIKALCLNVCNPLRTKFGPYSPTSGYRCEALNRLVSRSTKSRHLTGNAFDVVFYNSEKGNYNGEVFFYMLANHETVKWTKIIWEKGNNDNPAWLHIEYVEGEKKRVFITHDTKSYQNYFESAYYSNHVRKGLVK